MVANRSKLPAREVNQRLQKALTDLRTAERNAVLWFSEVVRRKLYRDLGYSSVYQYAELELSFSKSKTAQFLRLCESFNELPALRESVAKGELSWTKAREVAKVATRKTEVQWIQEAKQTSSRKLESRVKRTRRRAVEATSSARNQILLAESSAPTPAGLDSSGHSIPMDVHVRMSADQYSRYQSLLVAIQKKAPDNRAELLLAGLEQLALMLSAEAKVQVENPAPAQAANPVPAVPPLPCREQKFTRVNSRSPYQVIVQQCSDCGSGKVATSRGDKKLTPHELRAILCDATRRLPGKKNKAAVPPRLRRAVLERDRFRCRAAGCNGTGFLAVHHLVCRKDGGANALENLITLCGGCHRALHAMELHAMELHVMEGGRHFPALSSSVAGVKGSPGGVSLAGRLRRQLE